jgi:hypothetical protein
MKLKMNIYKKIYKYIYMKREILEELKETYEYIDRDKLMESITELEIIIEWYKRTHKLILEMENNKKII